MKKLLTFTLVDDGNDEAVNTEDTSHDTGNQRLENELGLEDTDGADTDTGFGSTVSGTEVSENEGTRESHESKEGVLVHSGGVC
jgi:hypothetical protein